MGRDRRSKPSPSACPRRGAQELPFARRGEVRPRHARAEAPRTPMLRGSTSVKPIAGRASRAPFRGFSNANRAVQCRGARSRARPDEPPGAVPPLRVPLRRARRCGRRVLPAAPPQHVKRRAPERDIAGSAKLGPAPLRTCCPRIGRLTAGCHLGRARRVLERRVCCLHLYSQPIGAGRQLLLCANVGEPLARLAFAAAWRLSFISRPSCI
jgi:hypothetical protein